MADRQEEAYGAANYEKRQAYERQIKSPTSTYCVTSRHATTRQAQRVVRVATWRDVSCRACCAVLVSTWRTTKKQ